MGASRSQTAQSRGRDTQKEGEMEIYKITTGIFRNKKVTARSIRGAVKKLISQTKPKPEDVGMLAEVTDSKGTKWYIDPNQFMK